jgi:hypothetical protein
LLISINRVNIKSPFFSGCIYGPSRCHPSRFAPSSSAPIYLFANFMCPLLTVGLTTVVERKDVVPHSARFLRLPGLLHQLNQAHHILRHPEYVHQ